MLRAFHKGDFPTFVSFNIQPVIEMMGGDSAFAKILETEAHARADVRFTVLKPGNVLRVLRDSSGAQCLIEQLTEITVNGTSVSTVSHLIGISSKEVPDWRYIDANSMPREEILGFIPFLNPELLIPEKKSVNGMKLNVLLKNYRTKYPAGSGSADRGP
jgi:hypothetical protein